MENCPFWKAPVVKKSRQARAQGAKKSWLNLSKNCNFQFYTDIIDNVCDLICRENQFEKYTKNNGTYEKRSNNEYLKSVLSKCTHYEGHLITLFGRHDSIYFLFSTEIGLNSFALGFRGEEADVSRGVNISNLAKKEPANNVK